MLKPILPYVCYIRLVNYSEDLGKITHIAKMQHMSQNSYHYTIIK